MRQVIDQEPKRPSTLNVRIDRDLETICRKCLEKDPQRRYNSAAGLADDLERFLGHEPIRARPSTTGERIVKWARRHPGIATLSTALAVTFVVSFIAVVALWRHAEHETDRVREAAKREAVALLGSEAAKESFLEQARAYRTSGQMASASKLWNHCFRGAHPPVTRGAQ
jgi:hypothetical protein